MYRDCGEGPFVTRKQAEEFGSAEVGMPWRATQTVRGWIVEVDCLEDLPPLPKDLRCPCGNDRMLYVEDICCAREVDQFDDDGVLRINGFYTTDGFDDGTNPRIQCSSCCREFAVPDEVEFD